MLMSCGFNPMAQVTPGFVLLIVIGVLFWLAILAAALWRSDLDPVTKFMWVFVIVSLSIVGALLYLLIAPSVAKARHVVPDRQHPSDKDEPAPCVACGAAIPAGSGTCPACGWSYGKAQSSAGA